MMPKEPDLPPPELLKHKAAAMPRQVDLRSYIEVMEMLKDKGYNYREIAEWMSEELNIEITRSQVVYALNTPDMVQADDEQARYVEDLRDKADDVEHRPK